MRRLVVLPLLAALTLTGCGSGGEDSAPEPTPPSRATVSDSPTSDDIETPNSDLPGPEADVKAYSDAFLTGDADAAFQLLSTRCREQLGSSAFGTAVEQAGELYGSPLEFESYSETVTEDGTAAVTYTYALSAINQTDEPWVNEGGAWRNDDC